MRTCCCLVHMLHHPPITSCLSTLPSPDPVKIKCAATCDEDSKLHAPCRFHNDETAPLSSSCFLRLGRKLENLDDTCANHARHAFFKTRRACRIADALVAYASPSRHACALRAYRWGPREPCLLAKQIASMRLPHAASVVGAAHDTAATRHDIRTGGSEGSSNARGGHRLVSSSNACGGDRLAVDAFARSHHSCRI